LENYDNNIVTWSAENARETTYDSFSLSSWRIVPI